MIRRSVVLDRNHAHVSSPMRSLELDSQLKDPTTYGSAIVAFGQDKEEAKGHLCHHSEWA